MSENKKIVYVKYFPDDMLQGCALLTFQSELVYRRICDHIYTSGNRLFDDEITWQVLTAKFHTNNDVIERIKSELIRKNKIYIKDGLIGNKGCDKWLEEAKSFSEAKSNAGKKGAQARWNGTAIDLPKATNSQQPTANSQQSTRQLFEEFWNIIRFKKGKEDAKKVFVKINFDKEKLKNTFVGHPILDNTNHEKIEINELLKGKIISIFPGSRLSELKSHVPILIEFIKRMNREKNNYNYIFHATEGSKEYLSQIIKKNNLENVDLISNENIKIATIKKSIFAIVKSGTVSLEVCKYGVPSIIIYKMNFLNFFIAKLFLKIKYANMINIINNKEIIPELLQKECNSDEIYKTVNYLLKKPELINEQLKQVNKTIKELRSNTSSSNEASNVLLSYLR